MRQVGYANSVALVGLIGYVVDVEVHLANGLPAFTLVGLPDAAVKEARHRVRSALAIPGMSFRARRCTINLAPANVPKHGTGFDLAIAVAIMRAERGLPVGATGASGTAGESEIYIGELRLDGCVVAVPGVLPMVKAAHDAGARRVYVPRSNVAEASLITGIEVLGVQHIAEIAAEFDISISPNPAIISSLNSGVQTPAPLSSPNKEELDLRDVFGQDEARRALEVAAAGGHHWMMIGAPGAGKTMLAERMPSVLPQLSTEEALEIATVASVAGNATTELSFTPPFVAPHHSASLPAIVGGGTRIATPGAVSRAHHGILFLDEAPEFTPSVLDSLRQPLESGSITIERASVCVTYPARFQLVLAANPCPCGMANSKRGDCCCTPYQRQRYRARLSGPLLDRIDITTSIQAPAAVTLKLARDPESSAAVRARVSAARDRSKQRWSKYGFSLNAHIPSRLLRALVRENSIFANEINRALEQGRLTMRGADKVMRIAWTIADLAEKERPGIEELGQAVALRGDGGYGY